MEDNQAKSTVPDHDVWIGQVIANKFAIEARLGSGAMGIVYRAKQLALQRTVAVKVLHREVAADEEFAARFWREARAASRLDHVNSIRVIDFGREPDGLMYLAMEYVEGCDLFEWVSRNGRPSVRSVAEILSQVLAALAVAHDMGVVHRDLKPENIMVVRAVSDDGEGLDVVKVCDFGIAKLLDASPIVTSARRQLTAGFALGTPAYMSPEQARGEDQDARSDLYSVGIVLYELLTEQLPFVADSVLAVMLKQINDEPVPPSACVSDVDSGLEAICMKALRKDRADRYQSAREMRGALLAAASGAHPASVESGRLSGTPARVTPRPGRRPSSRPSLAGVTPGTLQARAVRSRAYLVALATALCLLILWGVNKTLQRHGRDAVVARAASSALSVLSSAALPSTVDTTAGRLAASAVLLPEMLPNAGSGDSRRAAVKTRTRPPSALLLDTSRSAPVEPRSAVPDSVPLQTGLPTGSLPLPTPPPPAAPTPEAARLEPLPTPRTPPRTPPPPSAVATYDVAHAKVAIGAATHVVGATSASVTRAVSGAMSGIADCYRAALPNLRGLNEGLDVLRVDTDGAGVITDAHLRGPIQGGLTACVAAAVRGRRVANVDTGSATADVALSFRSH